jgi:ribosomal protein L32
VIGWSKSGAEIMTTLSESAGMPRYPTCPNCGDNVLREHLNMGDEVCRWCGPTRELDTYGELERDRFYKWSEKNAPES